MGVSLHSLRTSTADISLWFLEDWNGCCSSWQMHFWMGVQSFSAGQTIQSPCRSKKLPWQKTTANQTYCWWTKACTTKDDDYPIIYRVLTIPGGAGFLPSTVANIFEADFGFLMHLVLWTRVYIFSGGRVEGRISFFNHVYLSFMCIYIHIHIFQPLYTLRVSTQIICTYVTMVFDILICMYIYSIYIL